MRRLFPEPRTKNTKRRAAGISKHNFYKTTMKRSPTAHLLTPLSKPRFSSTHRLVPQPIFRNQKAWKWILERNGESSRGLRIQALRARAYNLCAASGLSSIQNANYQVLPKPVHHVGWDSSVNFVQPGQQRQINAMLLVRLRDDLRSLRVYPKFNPTTKIFNCRIVRWEKEFYGEKFARTSVYGRDSVRIADRCRDGAPSTWYVCSFNVIITESKGSITIRFDIRGTTWPRRRQRNIEQVSNVNSRSTNSRSTDAKAKMTTLGRNRKPFAANAEWWLDCYRCWTWIAPFEMCYARCGPSLNRYPNVSRLPRRHQKYESECRAPCAPWYQ